MREASQAPRAEKEDTLWKQERVGKLLEINYLFDSIMCYLSFFDYSKPTEAREGSMIIVLLRIREGYGDLWKIIQNE